MSTEQQSPNLSHTPVVIWHFRVADGVAEPLKDHGVGWLVETEADPPAEVFKYWFSSQQEALAFVAAGEWGWGHVGEISAAHLEELKRTGSLDLTPEGSTGRLTATVYETRGRSTKHHHYRLVDTQTRETVAAGETEAEALAATPYLPADCVPGAATWEEVLAVARVHADGVPGVVDGFATERIEG